MAQPDCSAVEVLDGELMLDRNGQRRTCRAGEPLEIPAGVPHCECHAAAPLHFIAGLRHEPAGDATPR